MSTRRSLAASVLVALAVVLVPAARAEVSVQTDAYGNYVRTTVLTQSTVRQLRIWNVVRRHVWGIYALNPDGDRSGDQYPAIAENPANRNHPWAVWSRFNGSDFDLVWSRWLPDGWSAIQRVDDGTVPGDDLGPALVFDGGGRPTLAWWRAEEGTGRVFLTTFLATQWTTPLAVSDPGVDSRNPRLGVQFDGSIRIEYDTPDGTEARVVSLVSPASIVDDLNPVGSVRGRPSGP